MVDPIEMVDLPLLRDGWFEIETFEIGGQGSGLGQLSEVQDPRWRFEYRIAGFPSLAHRQPVQTFLRSIKMRRTPVLCFDPNRRVPMSFLDGRELATVQGSPWGNPVVVEHDRSDSTITLEGFASGTVLTDGDYISFQDGAGLWHLHALEEPATVGLSGRVTLKVLPRPARGLVYGSPQVRMRDACCQGYLQHNPSELTYGAGRGPQLVIRGFEMRRAFI